MMKTSKHSKMRARRARLKKLAILAAAQEHQQSLFSRVAYRHGQKNFVDHGTYYGSMKRQAGIEKH